VEKRCLIDQWQKVTDGDMQNISLFPEQSLDDIVHDIGITGQGFYGFPVVTTAPTVVTIGNGRFYQNGLVYFNDTNGGFAIDLLSSLPLVTEKIVAIVVWGTSVPANTQPRTFLTDPVSRASVARAKSTEQWRWANLSIVNGLEGPDPIKPAVASNVLEVAWVTLNPTGILSIEMATAHMVPSITLADTRLNDFDLWRASAGSILATLRADLTGLANRIGNLANLDIVRSLAAQIAKLNEEADVPLGQQESFASLSNSFFDSSKSDIGNVDYLAKIEEGMRFADAAVADANITLLNPLDPNAISSGNFILPAYTKNTRISQLGSDLELNISNYPHQTIAYTLLNYSRFRLRSGDSYIIGNEALWFNEHYDYGQVFPRFPEVFSPLPADVKGEPPGPLFVRTQGYWYDELEGGYWDEVVSTGSLNGSVVAETFLNAQAGYLTDVGFMVSRAANTGDINVLICKLRHGGGAPDLTQVIAMSTVLVADIQPTPFRSAAHFAPVLLEAGERYAIVFITSGNHYLWMTKNNKYTDGICFTSTDGAWFAGDLTTDIAFDLKFAQFNSPRVEILLQPLQLGGGIVGIDLNADAAVPGGTQLSFQVQQAGVWNTLSKTFTVVGQPAILPFKAVFVGSSQLMPLLGVNTNSNARTNRSRADFTYIGLARTVSGATNITVNILAAAWRDTHHTILAILLTDVGFATPITASTVVVKASLQEGVAYRKFIYTFTISAGIPFKLKVTGTTDNVVTPYIITRIIDVCI